MPLKYGGEGVEAPRAPRILPSKGGGSGGGGSGFANSRDETKGEEKKELTIFVPPPGGGSGGKAIVVKYDVLLVRFGFSIVIACRCGCWGHRELVCARACACLHVCMMRAGAPHPTDY